MKKGKSDPKLQADLQALVDPAFDGMTVTVEFSERWKRMSVHFVWDGFDGLLPEERFHRLASSIGEEFRESRLAGFVWVETTPSESIDDALKMPRSEDVAEREAEIAEALRRVGLLEALKKGLAPDLQKNCCGDFSKTVKALQSKKAANLIDDAKLVSILHGAYCDCQVVQSVLPELAKRHSIEI